MSITIRDQLIFLVIFSLAALLLLVRLHADDERASWLQRRIGDPATVTGLYLRGGAAFVTIAVVGSLFLTSAAASARWRRCGRASTSSVDVGQEFQRFLPAGGGSTRLSSVDFGDSAVIRASGPPTARRPSRSRSRPTRPAYYWRAMTYDRFNGRAWLWSKTANVDAPAGTPALSGNSRRSGRAARPPGRDVHGPRAELQPEVDLRPGHAGSVDVDTRLTAVPGIPEGGTARSRTTSAA